MLIIAGILAVAAFLLTDVGKLVTGGFLIFLAESAIGLLVIAALLGVFK